MAGPRSQRLHERFLQLQKNAESFTAGQQISPAFTAEMESYYTDLHGYLLEVEELVKKAPPGAPGRECEGIGGRLIYSHRI